MITDKHEDIATARKREARKAAHLRALAYRQFTCKDLLEVFGLAVANRLRHSPAHSNVGKNYFSKNFHAGAHNPTGSKLMRRFIRANGVGSAAWERSYKALTGRRYDHLNLGEEDQPA